MKNEPVLTAGVIVAAVIALANIFGVVLDQGTVETIVTDGLVLLGAVTARSKVTPVNKTR